MNRKKFAVGDLVMFPGGGDGAGGFLGLLCKYDGSFSQFAFWGKADFTIYWFDEAYNPEAWTIYDMEDFKIKKIG